MDCTPENHFSKTKKLAQSLKPQEIYQWLITKGYFPESYVLPPCFTVTKHPEFGKQYFKYGKDKHGKHKFNPRISEFQQVHFPKTELTDRTFGVIDPEIHSDISHTITSNWSEITDSIFHHSNKVCSYSFPIPLNSKKPGSIGELRSGRMIYEFIEMAENDVASIAFRYKYLIKTDVKNFYPSIYTHSIPWALYGKDFARKVENRNNYDLFGNRLDKLFQNANDGCTNGLPIGPVVSDLIAEIILSGVDREFSKEIDDEIIVVRFKDDYRILVKNEATGRTVIKSLQSALKTFKLELNDGKTEIYKLPNGLFRNWVSEYHAANPKPKAAYDFKKFREVYLAVVRIDKNNPGTGIIDRFLADIVTKKYKVRIRLDSKSLPKVISLLLMLAELRTKSFPKVLAVIEAILKSNKGSKYEDIIVDHLENYLNALKSREEDNTYLISWIIYFIRSNNLERKMENIYEFRHPIVKAIHASKFSKFQSCKDFKIFTGVKTIAKKISLLEHLDVFKPQ